MFAYKMMMMVMLLDNIIRLIPKLFLLTLYCFTTGLILIYCNENNFSKLILEIKNPIHTFEYLYFYIKWWVNNKENLELKYMLYILISSISPYFIFLTLRWILHEILKFIKFLLKQFFYFIFKKVNKRKNNNSSNIINVNQKPDSELIKKEILNEIYKIIEKINSQNGK